jgi:hypothetical protein
MKKFREEEKKKEWEIINAKIEELKLSEKEKDKLKKEVYQKEIQIYRLMSAFI